MGGSLAAGRAVGGEGTFDGATEVLVERAARADAAVGAVARGADDVERARDGVGGDRESTRQCRDVDEAEGAGANGKDEDVGRGVGGGEFGAVECAEEGDLGIGLAQGSRRCATFSSRTFAAQSMIAIVPSACSISAVQLSNQSPSL